MPKPSTIPEWNTGTANNTEPNGAKKILGWTSGEKPVSSSFLNWWMNLVYLWMVWLDAFEGTAHTWSAKQTFDIVETEGDLTVDEDLEVTGNINPVGGINNTAVPPTSAGTLNDLINNDVGTTLRVRNTGAGIALDVGAGNAKFTASNPAGTAGFTNTVTPLNITKGFGFAFTDAVGGADMDSNFNMTTPTCPGANKLKILIVNDMAGTDYTLTGNAQKADGTPLVWTKVTKNAAYIEVKFWDMAGGAIDPAAVAVEFNFHIDGEQ